MLKFLASLVVVVAATVALTVAAAGPLFTLAAIIGLISMFALVITLIKDARRLGRI
jgi:hypothetical protein